MRIPYYLPACLFSLCLFSAAGHLSAQLSVAAIGLPYGEYSVGYRHHEFQDSSRTYYRDQRWTNKYVPRPIPTSVWYPADSDQPAANFMSVFDYLKTVRDEEEWEHLPDDQIFNWFEFPNNAANRERARELVRARHNATPLPGPFPVVIYAPSFLASSTENFALCELLASHGYVVLSAPGRGAAARPMNGPAVKNSEAQARDLEYLVAFAGRQANADWNQLALLDYSFGGLATTITAMRNDRVKAVASLDGRSRYDYETIFANPSADLDKFDVPFLHLAQKEIPAAVLAEDGIDPSLNSTFRLFDSLRYSDAYALRFNDLSHTQFSTFGVLLKDRDPRQDKGDRDIMNSYRWLSVYVLNFLNATLRNDASGKAFLIGTPEKNGVAEGAISLRRKPARAKALTLRDFNDVAAARGYDNLSGLLREFRTREPGFTIPEWQLNNLGLQLGFDPESTPHAVAIYDLAIALYPASANLYDSLAEIHLYAGNRKAAIKNFTRSLQLNPQNENASTRLEQLR